MRDSGTTDYTDGHGYHRKPLTPFPHRCPSRRRKGLEEVGGRASTCNPWLNIPLLSRSQPTYDNSSNRNSPCSRTIAGFESTDMKTRLARISPGDLGLFLGTLGFLISIPAIIFACMAVGHGGTVSLNGFLSYTFTDSLPPIGIVLAYPFLNGLAGFIGGLILGWLYNFYARHFDGITVELEDADKPHETPLTDYTSQSCGRCGYTIGKGIAKCPNCGAGRS